MNEAAILGLLIQGVTQVNSLVTMYAKMRAEGRTDLTDEEVAQVRAQAYSTNEALGATIASMPDEPATKG